MDTGSIAWAITATALVLFMRRPDIVTFVPFSIARHTKLWNYDREGWNSAIRSWLGDLAPIVR